jgi:hypothetical protein
MNEQLRGKLLAMRADDTRVREKLAATGELFDGYNPLIERVHLKNAAELERMIDEHGGWLGKSTVGADGAEAAWLIVQHAISLPEFFRKCLRLIERAVAENEAERIRRRTSLTASVFLKTVRNATARKAIGTLRA